MCRAASRGILRMPMRSGERILKNPSDSVRKFLRYALKTRSGSPRRGISSCPFASARARFAGGVLFIRREKVTVHKEREKCTRRNIHRKRSFISIDRRSRGVGEIVYLCARICLRRVPPRAIFLNLGARVYRRRNLPRLKCPPTAQPQPQPRSPSPSSTETFFHRSPVPHFASAATFSSLSRFTRASPRYAHDCSRPW